ncbi:hypothetical protein B9Z55_026720 [Caenorhabditis nigoni]|uniref:SCP domain-containing protein n=1 Tax=Caenorhabditis nigoni TaxID=1611254 RepID=A0A2G5SH27_9PELO|nr:hypothetical protein B9Z55_026720 [Caenorhabditis nigoni]
MKLFILLLLLVSTAYNQYPRLPDYRRQRCADETNAYRSHYAKQHSIANMNKLDYNPELEQKLLDKWASIEQCPDTSVKYEDGFVFGLNVKNSKGLIHNLASNAGSMEIACIETTGCEDVPVLSIVMDFG